MLRLPTNSDATTRAAKCVLSSDSTRTSAPGRPARINCATCSGLIRLSYRSALVVVLRFLAERLDPAPHLIVFCRGLGIYCGAACDAPLRALSRISPLMEPTS